MVISKTELREAIYNLTEENKRNMYRYLEDIFKIIISSVDDYEKDNNDNKWNTHEEDIIDIFYDSLSETYANTSKRLGKIYSKVKEFDIEDIFDITYRKDGKTLEERIHQYWHDGLLMLKNEELSVEPKAYLEYYLERLLTNETAIIETTVKKNKIPVKASLLVIEGGCTCGCGECDDYVGEYPVNEDVDLPPFHPNCTCICYYEETDNIDEIEDLDLEPEELGEVDIEVEE